MGSHIKHDDVLYIAYIICLLMIVLFNLMKVSTVESRSIVSTSIVFPHVLFAIFGPELSSI